VIREQRRARLDRHREHASHIAFWVELAEVDEDLGDVAILTHFANTSKQPALNVMIFAGIRRDAWITGGGADGLPSYYCWNTVAIGPGVEDVRTIRLERVPASVVRLVDAYGDEAVIGELHFTDSSGFGWVRCGSGQLIGRTSALWESMAALSPAARDDRLRLGTLQPRLRRRLLLRSIRRLS
jgi:hypothetical protein